MVAHLTVTNILKLSGGPFQVTTRYSRIVDKQKGMGAASRLSAIRMQSA